MLEFNYSEQLSALIEGLDWQIQMPPEWTRFFEESGPCTSVVGDQRGNSRMRIRTHAILRYETALPSVPRTSESLGVYTKDFSRRGCGFISPVQIYPEESVRIVLATFWIRLRVVRARRVGPACFEVGGELTESNQPSLQAFDGFEMCSVRV